MTWNCAFMANIMPNVKPSNTQLTLSAIKPKWQSMLPSHWPACLLLCVYKPMYSCNYYPVLHIILYTTPCINKPLNTVTLFITLQSCSRPEGYLEQSAPHKPNSWQCYCIN